MSSPVRLNDGHIRLARASMEGFNNASGRPQGSDTRSPAQKLQVLFESMQYRRRFDWNSDKSRVGPSQFPSHEATLHDGQPAQAIGQVLQFAGLLDVLETSRVRESEVADGGGLVRRVEMPFETFDERWGHLRGQINGAHPEGGRFSYLGMSIRAPHDELVDVIYELGDTRSLIQETAKTIQHGFTVVQGTGPEL